MLQIETPRLVLRPLCSGDALDIVEATYETWEDLSLWMRWATDKEQFTDIENCKSYADDCYQKFQDRKDFTFGGFIKNSGDFVLISRLAHLDDDKTYEFGGYWCRKSYQKNGYMSEAVNAIIRYSFSEMGAKHFQITHAAGNVKTRAVIDKLGFIETNIRENAHNLPSGKLVDEHVLTLADIDSLPDLNVSWH